MFHVSVSGLEQFKAREDEVVKEEQMETESAAKDRLVKRRGLSDMVGQAISVVGCYPDKQAPNPKRLPEPILPTAQIK